MSMANMKDGERLELLKEIGGTKVGGQGGSRGIGWGGGVVEGASHRPGDGGAASASVVAGRRRSLCIPRVGWPPCGAHKRASR